MFMERLVMKPDEILKYIRFFRGKLQTDKLIVFVGAGVSRNVKGMPDWNDLIKKMADAIKYSRCDFCTKKTKKCKETCKFYDEFSNDEFLKIPQYVYNRSKRLYERVLLENIEHDRSINAPLSNAIFDLAPAHIITTNYDKLIENCKNVQKDNYGIIVYDKDLLECSKNKYVIKMHGDIDDLNTIVLKESDYLEYTQNHVLIEMFVKSLLTDHTILFLGYSLNDYNIKLIISWINHIRAQNKLLKKDTKFGYIVADNEKITSTKRKYFEKNYIGIVNIHEMPLIKDIPQDLDDDRGKRLYSFLSIIGYPLLEKYFYNYISFDEVIVFLQSYKYVNGKNICDLLCFGGYSLSGNELVLYSETNYDLLINYIKTKTESAKILGQLLYNAGIICVRLLSTSSHRHEEYKIIGYHNTILDDKLFELYLNNDYDSLNLVLAKSSNDNPLEFCFYQTIIQDYTKEMLEYIELAECCELSVEDKIRCLFNKAAIEGGLTYHYTNKNITKYIEGIYDKTQKKIFKPYQDIFDGNYQQLYTARECLEKLKDQYYISQTLFINGDSLPELYKIKRIAYDQYLFYFNNTLIFKNYSDLKKILKIYIEAIVCTNGRFIEKTFELLKTKGKKDRYKIDEIDFDIITKFISIKDLYNIIEEYNLERFEINEDVIEHIILCFENIVKSIISLNLYNRFDAAPNILVNCMIILTKTCLNGEQRIRISNIIHKLIKEKEFLNFFFSDMFPEITISLRVFNNLLKLIPVRKNFAIVKNIINNPNFKSYYVNTNIRVLQEVLSVFIDTTKSQDELSLFISSFEGINKVNVIHLLYKHITSIKEKNRCKNFLSSNFDKLGVDDIFEFVYNNMLDITDVEADKILENTLKIYHQQKNNGVYIRSDSLSRNLDLICILYITGKINSLDALNELAGENDFLQFFVNHEEFDYSKVDFSKYMWENIARQPEFMIKLIEHKEDIIPKINQRIELEQATEFERKILYGYLLDRDSMLNF